MQEKLELRIDPGTVIVPIIDDKDGTTLGEFKFNPNDPDILKRYETVVEKMESISVPDDAGADEIFAVSDELKAQMDYLLNCKVSDGIFAVCNPLTLTADGDFYIEKVIAGIAALIEQTTDARLEKKKAKIRKATEKYHK